MLCYLIPCIPSHEPRFIKFPPLWGGQGGVCPLVVHRGVEPRFSEPKSGVIPIYEWTALFKKRAKLLQKIQIRKYFCKKMQLCSHKMNFWAKYLLFAQ